MAADRWSAVAPLPERLHHPAAAAVAGKLYVVGGFHGTYAERDPAASVWAYDPGTDRWEQRASLSTPRGAAAAVALDGRLYALGGERRARVAGRGTTSRWRM